MTKNFDSLLESLLNEMMPADISGFDGGAGGASKHILKNVPEGEPKGHWAPLQKLSPEDREKVVDAILNKVFTERGNTFSPNTDNAEELKSAIASAVKEVSGETSLKASGNYAAKFLSDRIMTLLKSTVKYTTDGGEELNKDITQKEFKKALDQAISKKEAPAETEGETKETSSEAEMVYTKAADLSSDDSDLKKAFNKLPDNKEMSWKEVLKTVGMSSADALIQAGGLIETEKEQEESEDSEVAELELDADDTADYDPMRDIGSSFGEYERELRSKYDF
jgi:hypothetical protein